MHKDITSKNIFAIIRFDEYLKTDNLIDKVAVKGIVQTQKQAEDEVERLNSLNSEKGCIYFGKQLGY